MEKEEADVIKMQLSAYLNAIDVNDRIMEKAARLIRWEGGMLGAIVFLLLALSILPR